MDFIAEFYNAMKQHGIAPEKMSDIVADDKIQRYKVDGDTKKNGAYCLKIDNDFAYGWFMSFKLHESPIGWHSSNAKPLTPEEAESIRKKREEQREKATAEVNKRHEQAKQKAIETWKSASEVDPKHTYIVKKKIKPVHIKQHGNILYIPIYKDKVIVNLQSIYKNGDKRYVQGGQLKGCYSVIPGDTETTIYICEGYATGNSIHIATESAVFCSMQANNLLCTATFVKAKFPKANIILCADNDCETTDQKGEPYNTGIVYAKKVKKALQIDYIYPQLQDKNKKCDFNDLYCEEGISEVRRQLGIVESESEIIHEDIPIEAYQEDVGNVIKSDEPYKVLGYNNNNYYYLPQGRGQIVTLSASSHTMPNLVSLARLDYWVNKFGDDSTSHAKIALYATDDLMGKAERAGVFKPDVMIRGAGAWKDGDRYVIHCGDKLYVDGKIIEPYNFDSDYVYEKSVKAFSVANHSLSNADSIKLREICESLTWENKLSGALLAGWCVIAPICAMLQWRPHIWITGEAQSGKTTVVSDIIERVLGKVALKVDGGTTEAAIRQTLGHDGRPVIYDEAESENQRDQMVMQGILQLARRSSSGGQVLKGSANGDASLHQARSAFCFSGINPSIKERADQTRISILTLRRNTKVTAQEDYKVLQKRLSEELTEDFGKRLFARTISNLRTIIKNCHTFTDAIASVLEDRRAGDQIGTMLAGLYSLGSNKEISLKHAKEWVMEKDWSIHTAISEKSDPERLVTHIATSRLRVLVSGTMQDMDIGTLIDCELNGYETSAGAVLVTKDDAQRALRQHGIHATKKDIYIANQSQGLQKLLRNTVWHAGWAGTLKLLKGAEPVGTTYFNKGSNSRATKVPITYFQGI